MATRSQDDDVIVVGAAAHPFRDAYHSVLRMSWPGVLFGIAGAFLFSVQTMGTIGYGSMYPVSTAAHAIAPPPSPARGP